MLHHLVCENGLSELATSRSLVVLVDSQQLVAGNDLLEESLGDIAILGVGLVILDPFDQEVADSLQQTIDNGCFGTVLEVTESKAQFQVRNVAHVKHHEGVGVRLEKRHENHLRLSLLEHILDSSQASLIHIQTSEQVRSDFGAQVEGELGASRLDLTSESLQLSFELLRTIRDAV